MFTRVTGSRGDDPNAHGAGLMTGIGFLGAGVIRKTAVGRRTDHASPS